MPFFTLQTSIFPIFIFFFLISPSLQLPINIWPKPTSLSWPLPLSTFLSPNFTIISPRHVYLSPAVHRYLHLIKSERHKPLTPIPHSLTTVSSPLLSLTITVSDLSAPLHHGVNESYTLHIPATGTAVLKAETAWGAMRGLESFSQLVWVDPTRPDPTRVLAGLTVRDGPVFGHRGVVLDTARNYYGVEDIKRTIRGMSMNKMNVFHWHLTDSQSFPVEVPSEPEMAAKGSYGGDMQYSTADVRRVVEFGMEHGVRVLPEIDTPGHTGSWALAHPDIVTCAGMFWWPAGTKWEDRLASEPATGQLNPLNPKTYKVLKNIIQDITSLFPEPFFHSGADEIIPGCWKVDPSIKTFLSNGGTLNQLLEIFINSTLPLILSRNRTVVFWEDVFLDSVINVSSTFLPKEHVILQTWNNGTNNTKRIVSAGYRVIVSSSEFYYLDCGHGEFVGNDSQFDVQANGESKDGGSWCGPFKTWQTVYNYDITEGLSEEEKKLVLGGEVALWSEQADPTVLDGRLWPRASAFAEAMWSGNRDESGKKRYAEATDRLNEWRGRMVRRGIGAEPIQPLWCVRNPGMCNTVQPASTT